MNVLIMIMVVLCLSCLLFGMLTFAHQLDTQLRCLLKMKAKESPRDSFSPDKNMNVLLNLITISPTVVQKCHLTSLYAKVRRLETFSSFSVEHSGGMFSWRFCE